jgi:NTP pyrophosphatase (non-canonical NTP hydrolase)
MEFGDYQSQTRTKAIYPEVGNNFIFPTLGLVGEAGEFADKIKKIIRDKDTSTPDTISEYDKLELVKELGDVLWYLTQLASELKVSLDEVAKLNLEKIGSRYERGVVQGEGDNR